MLKAPIPSATHRWDSRNANEFVDMRDGKQLFALAELKDGAKKDLRDMKDYATRLAAYFEAVERDRQRAAKGGAAVRDDQTLIAKGRSEFGEVIKNSLDRYGLSDNLGPVDADESRKYGNDIYWEIVQEEYRRLQQKQVNKGLRIVVPSIPGPGSHMGR